MAEAVDVRYTSNHLSIAELLRIVRLIGLACAFSNMANAAEVNPLLPVDTSSPRASLQGFIGTIDDLYRNMKDILHEYSASQRLYHTPDERRRQAELLSAAAKAITVLDLSDVAPILRGTIGPERVLQLKEVLDRIELPSPESIPDQDAMSRASSKRWRLPRTEIDIALIESGPRAGEYLVTADTVERLPVFYDRVRELAYKPGPAAELSQVYRRMSSGGATTIYEAYLSSPVGLERIVPVRWMLNLPGWAKVRIGGLASWQWLGLVSGLAVCVGSVYGVFCLGRRLGRNRPEEAGAGWHSLLTPLAIILVSAFPVPLLCTILRVGGTPRVVVTFVQTSALYLSAAWLSMIAASLIAEAFVESEHLRRHSLDSQLIRLGMRFAGIAIAVGLVVQGSYELGFPTYSVLAGLGVGGLAVALAARDSLANLLGSILIMIEKPFRIGHYVRVSGSEGTVENVGFRSTRIRTLDNSLISIPNNSVVNATVENLTLRVMRRERFFIQVTYDTPREKLEQLAAEIKRLIADHPLTNKKNFHVRFNDFGESSLNILVYFYLEVADLAAELEAREEILLEIMDLMHKTGIEFAFPTRTLVIENPPGRDADLSRGPVGAFLAGRSAE
ncbi:MAG: mechanosensitive ion channel family protein [Stellaceae bacterium]